MEMLFRQSHDEENTFWIQIFLSVIGLVSFAIAIAYAAPGSNLIAPLIYFFISFLFVGVACAFRISQVGTKETNKQPSYA